MKWAVPRNRANVKMAARGQPQKLKKEFCSFKKKITSHSQQHGRGCAFDFLKMLPLPMFKMAAMNQLHIFCGPNTQKLKS